MSIQKYSGQNISLPNCINPLSGLNGGEERRGEEIYYKMVYYTLCLDSVNRQRSRWKVRI